MIALSDIINDMDNTLEISAQSSKVHKDFQLRERLTFFNCEHVSEQVAHA